MIARSSRESTQADQAAGPERPRALGLPAWGLSLAFHAGILAAIAFWFAPTAPRGAMEESTRDVGIILARHSAEGTREYFTADDVGQDATHQPTQSSTITESLPERAENIPDTSQQLLDEALSGLGPAPMSGAPSESTGAMLEGGAPALNAVGGKARLNVFGAEGEGSKFVYVFDRSVSMQSYGALEAAKASIINSLDSLEKTHQFQIIFYNNSLALFDTSGRLVFGTDQKKRLAERSVRGITATGNTRHMEPLLVALRMRPDVIFFLTDADEPSLTRSELREIARRNRGAAIHAIEFGFGPDPGGDNFLRQLAAANQGQYSYVNISGFRR